MPTKEEMLALIAEHGKQIQAATATLGSMAAEVDRIGREIALSSSVVQALAAELVDPVVLPPPPDIQLGWGPGPRSGLPWCSGVWVNGGGDTQIAAAELLAHPVDAVTQSISGMTYWHEHAGCDSEATFAAEFAQPRDNFQPSLKGIFSNQGWRFNIYGGNGKEVRQRLIHLCWMHIIPRAGGNGWVKPSATTPTGYYKRPTIWAEAARGDYDQYLFHCGRVFGWLDDSVRMAHPMVLDLGYEGNQENDPDIWCGSYVVGNELRCTYLDYPAGFSRLLKAFRLGWEYQTGRPFPHTFCWRHMLKFPVCDRTGAGGTHPVRHEDVWPNLAAEVVLEANVVGDKTVMTAGPIGRMIGMGGVSWHDSGPEHVRGDSYDDPAGNWPLQYQGTQWIWGIKELFALCERDQVPVCFPEWAPVSGEAKDRPPSANPASVIRFMHWVFNQHRHQLAYECLFQIGNGLRLSSTWNPILVAEAAQPRDVYKQLWSVQA